MQREIHFGDGKAAESLSRDCYRLEQKGTEKEELV
jgi:hypothetical protein